MKKLIFIITIVLMFWSKAMPQEIITDASLSDSYISLGEEITVDFNINEISDCDSYSINAEIDYLFDEIIIVVDYDYDSSCEESSDYYSEEISFLPLLEGSYDVTIECYVSFNFDLDEKIDLDNLIVDSPDDYDCDASFVPIIFESCPLWGDEVCACNGQNYNNECEAYFENKHGVYYFFNCGDFVEENSINFECGDFFLNIDIGIYFIRLVHRAQSRLG